MDLSFFIGSSEENQTIRLIYEISLQEVSSIYESFSFAGNYSIIKSLKNIVINNGNEFLKFLDLSNLQKLAFAQKRSADLLLAEANRLIMNYCVASRIFIDRSNAIAKKNGPDESNRFIETIHSIYERNFSYQFFYRLRNYIVHDNLPYSGLKKSLPDNVELICSRDQLASSDSMKSLKKRLDKLPESIHIEDYIFEMNGCILTLYLEIIFAMREQIIGAHQMLNDLNKKYSIDLPMIGEGDPTTKKLTALHPLPLSILASATEDLKCHPNIKIVNESSR